MEKLLRWRGPADWGNCEGICTVDNVQPGIRDMQGLPWRFNHRGISRGHMDTVQDAFPG